MSSPVHQTTDPLDTPLPCDITIGAGTFRKGVKLSTFVAAARRWHERASLVELGNFDLNVPFPPNLSCEAVAVIDEVRQFVPSCPREEQ